MIPGEKFRAWLIASRTSARMAMVLRLVAMATSSVMSLVWTPLLTRSMGDAVYGTWMSFQGALRLAGLGDFGLAGAVTVRTGQMIGRGQEDRLHSFLATARTALLMLAVFLGGLFCAFSPWLPHWLKFEDTTGAGSLTKLFLMGGATIVIGLIAGYLAGLNAAYATVTWPIIPMLLLSQLALFVQWLAASGGAPLWLQAGVVAGGGCLQGALWWWMLRVSHPWLGNLWPLRFDPAVWRDLFGTSFWVYLYSLGNAVFTVTDRLLINAGFGAAAVTPYLFNYKLCEVAMQVVLSASYVGQSKINLWIANPAEEFQERSRQAVNRLGQFQAVAGTACALGYLAINNLFVEHWVGARYQMSAALQIAFALNLAVTTGGDAGIQIAGLCGPRGIRTAGAAIGGTALLNLALSFVSMKAGYIVGIAWATVIAQLILSVSLGCYTARYLKMPVGRWLTRACLLPAAAVVLLGLLFAQLGSTRMGAALCLLVAGGLLIILQARASGVGRQFLRHEWDIVRQMAGRKDKTA